MTRRRRAVGTTGPHTRGTPVRSRAAARSRRRSVSPDHDTTTATPRVAVAAPRACRTDHGREVPARRGTEHADPLGIDPVVRDLGGGPQPCHRGLHILDRSRVPVGGCQPIVDGDGDVSGRGQRPALFGDVGLVAPDPPAAVHQHHRCVTALIRGHVGVEAEDLPVDVAPRNPELHPILPAGRVRLATGRAHQAEGAHHRTGRDGERTQEGQERQARTAGPTRGVVVLHGPTLRPAPVGLASSGLRLAVTEVRYLRGASLVTVRRACVRLLW